LHCSATPPSLFPTQRLFMNPSVSTTGIRLQLYLDQAVPGLASVSFVFFSCSFHLTFCSSLQRITRSILHLNNADGIRVKRTHPMYQCFPKGVRKHKRCSPLPKCLLSYHGCTTTFGQFAGKASVGIKGKDRGQNAFTCVCFRRARR
jgi:hypothetical protein